MRRTPWRIRKELAKDRRDVAEEQRLNEVGPYQAFWDTCDEHFVIPVAEPSALESGLRAVLKELAESLAGVALHQLPREDIGAAVREMERRVQRAIQKKPSL